MVSEVKTLGNGTEGEVVPFCGGFLFGGGSGAWWWMWIVVMEMEGGFWTVVLQFVCRSLKVN